MNEERAPVVDAMRGIALFGVLTVNALTIFRISIFEQFLPVADRPLIPDTSSFDQTITSFVTTAMEMKAFLLFSLLFGVGLAVQHERRNTTENSGQRFSIYIARRLTMLLAIGTAHMFLVWNGDVLMLYAIIGAVTAPLLLVINRPVILLTLAMALFIVQALPLPLPSSFPSMAAVTEHIDDARHIYAYGSWSQCFQFRVVETKAIAVLLLWVAPRTMGLFLLGAAAWRAGVFRGAYPRLVRTIAVAGTLAGGAISWAIHAGILEARSWRTALEVWGAIVLGLGYGAAIVTAFRHPRIARTLSMLFGPIGRMALTSYLTQSLVLAYIFYGYGLGQFGRLTESKTMILVLAMFITQMIVAAVWMRRFRYGPFEWAWRSFTYGYVLPITAAAASKRQEPDPDDQR